MDNLKNIGAFLNEKAGLYQQPSFIPLDPISIPHQFSKKQDIEIAAFFAAILSWGNRKAIIQSCNRLMELMDNAPYPFIMDRHFKLNLEKVLKQHPFVHRTFNAFDLQHLLHFMHHHYFIKQEKSLETAFTRGLKPDDEHVGNALIAFQQYVFGYDANAHQEIHCRKHISSPEKKSACKRLNMFLRWMVRSQDNGIDFGLWKKILPTQLVCPLDVHVARVARKLGLVTRKQDDWQTALELTGMLKRFDAQDPVKYDFALFGLGVMEKF